MTVKETIDGILAESNSTNRVQGHIQLRTSDGRILAELYYKSGELFYSEDPREVVLKFNNDQVLGTEQFPLGERSRKHILFI